MPVYPSLCALQEVSLPASVEEHSIPVPSQFAGQNVMIEAVSGSLKSCVAYYSNSMRVSVLESAGQVRACVYLNV